MKLKWRGRTTPSIATSSGVAGRSWHAQTHTHTRPPAEPNRSILTIGKQKTISNFICAVNNGARYAVFHFGFVVCGQMILLSGSWCSMRMRADELSQGEGVGCGWSTGHRNTCGMHKSNTLAPRARKNQTYYFLWLYVAETRETHGWACDSLLLPSRHSWWKSEHVNDKAILRGRRTRVFHEDDNSLLRC